MANDRARPNRTTPVLALVLALALATMWPAAAYADDDCGAGGLGLRFGGYNGLDSQPTDSAGRLYVDCEDGVSYRILLDGGRSSGGQFHARQLRRLFRSGTLAYNLYLDPGRTLVWGDGTQGTSVYMGRGNDRPERIRVYGRIPARQRVPEGFYVDLVIVTIEW